MSHDFTKFKALKPKLMTALDEFLTTDIAKLMPLLRKEEMEVASQPKVQGGVFTGTNRGPFNDGNPFTQLQEDGEESELAAADWVVAKDKNKYDEIFYSLSPHNGKLNGSKVKNWMLSTQLPTSVLGRIWKLSDVDRDGLLDEEEFALASYLIEVKLDGHGLPPALPPHLVPPSKRRRKSSKQEEELVITSNEE